MDGTATLVKGGTLDECFIACKLFSQRKCFLTRRTHVPYAKEGGMLGDLAVGFGLVFLGLKYGPGLFWVCREAVKEYGSKKGA